MGIAGPPARSWGRARSAVRAVLAIAWLGWAASVGAQDAVPRQVTLEVVSSLEWTATGIEVGPGDLLAIEAEPAQVPGGAVVSPDGVAESPPTYANMALEGQPAPDLPYAALIGRIGGGPVFLVGRHYRVTTMDAGPLELRWNLAQEPGRGIVIYFPVVVRHEAADKARGDGLGNEIATNEIATEGNVVAENLSVETAVPPPPPSRSKATVGAPAPGSQPASRREWLLPGLALLLLAAAAAGLTFQRKSRARAVERTRAMVGLAPSLDLAEGYCMSDDLPAEGPAASLRTRIEEGVAHEQEGSGHG